MGSDQIMLGVIAVGAGLLVGIGLFVPFVAVSYRRHGTLPPGRLVLAVMALVYLWAIWTYTLLPLPDPETMVCAGTNLDPLAFVADLRTARGRSTGAADFLRDPAFLQLALNVLLFVPLGFFLRMEGRGVWFAGTLGFAVSALVETTQLTGVWGLYPCAYRVFDVNDLLTNTLGAVIGSLLALAIPRVRRGRAPATTKPSDPTPLTRPRRMLGMTADWIGFTLTAFTVSVGVQLYLRYVLHADLVTLSSDRASLAGSLVAIVVWAFITLATGKTIGDLAVQLRYEPGRLPDAVARTVRFLTGIGGYALLSLLPGPWEMLSTGYAVALVVAALATAGGAGLPTLLGRQRLTDSRSPAGSQPAGR